MLTLLKKIFYIIDLKQNSGTLFKHAYQSVGHVDVSVSDGMIGYYDDRYK